MERTPWLWIRSGTKGRLVRGDRLWQPTNPARGSKTIRLSKLHGSLHFQIAEKVVQRRDEAHVLLKEGPYTQHGTLKFSILPPEWSKHYDRGVFACIWRLASAAIHKAEHLIFIGYSLPAKDMHSTVLFRTSVKKEGLKSVVVVNPDPGARRRTSDVVQHGLSKSTRVLSFDFFREFAAADGGLWRDERK